MARITDRAIYDMNRVEDSELFIHNKLLVKQGLAYSSESIDGQWAVKHTTPSATTRASITQE